MKRRDVLSSAGFAALAMALDGGRPALADEVTITLLHCNDVYEIAPKAGIGGFAPYMTLLEAERARNPHTITTFGGDLLSPSLMSGLTKGSQMIELTNAIGVQIAVLGNHEFDFGPELAAARVTLARYETLWKQDSIARQDVDTQAALVKQLEGTVQSDSANERAAQINLGYTRMLAPIAGRIGLRAVDPGNMITAGNATAIATITQITPIDVSFAVPQDRVPEVLDAQRQGAMPVDALDRARARRHVTQSRQPRHFNRIAHQQAIKADAPANDVVDDDFTKFCFNFPFYEFIMQVYFTQPYSVYDVIIRRNAPRQYQQGVKRKCFERRIQQFIHFPICNLCHRRSLSNCHNLLRSISFLGF